MKPIDSMSFKRVGFTIKEDIKEEHPGEKNYDLRVNAYHFCEYDSDETEEQFTEEEEEEDDDDEKQEECGFLRTPPTLLINETVESKMDEFVIEKKSDVKALNDEKDEEILMIPSLEVSYSMTRQATNERATPSPQLLCVDSHLAGLYSTPSDDESSPALGPIAIKAPCFVPQSFDQVAVSKKVTRKRKRAKYVAPKHIQQKVNIHRAIHALSRQKSIEGKSRKRSNKKLAKRSNRNRNRDCEQHQAHHPRRQARSAKKFDFSVPPDQIVLSEEACQHLVDLCEYHTADEAECS